MQHNTNTRFVVLGWHYARDTPANTAAYQYYQAYCAMHLGVSPTSANYSPIISLYNVGYTSKQLTSAQTADLWITTTLFNTTRSLSIGRIDHSASVDALGGYNTHNNWVSPDSGSSSLNGRLNNANIYTSHSVRCLREF